MYAEKGALYVLPPRDIQSTHPLVAPRFFSCCLILYLILNLVMTCIVFILTIQKERRQCCVARLAATVLIYSGQPKISISLYCAGMILSVQGIEAGQRYVYSRNTCIETNLNSKSCSHFLSILFGEILNIEHEMSPRYPCCIL